MSRRFILFFFYTVNKSFQIFFEVVVSEDYQFSLSRHLLTDNKYEMGISALAESISIVF